MWRNDDESIEFVRVVGEHLIQPSNGGIQWRTGPKTEVDHARMGLVLDENQLAKIPIMGDEHAGLLKCNSEHLVIRQARGVFASNSGDIMSQS